MKIENIIGIIETILIIIFVSFISADYFSNQKNLNQVISNINIPINNTGQTSQLVAENVSIHNSVNDCWLIIDNKVFDVSDYLRLHPGGQAIVIPYCGKETTAAFANRGGEGTHSQNAIEQLGGLYIGEYDQQAGTVKVISNTNTDTKSETNTNSNAIPDNMTTTSNIPSSVSLTTELIATHNTRSDCWIIINSNVYGVSNYLNSHPGGSSIIIPYCGADATQAFATQGGNGSHSSSASSQLNNYLIGQLGSDTTTTQINDTQQNINQIIPSTTQGEDGEEEEEEEEDDD